MRRSLAEGALRVHFGVIWQIVVEKTVDIFLCIITVKIKSLIAQDANFFLFNHAYSSDRSSAGIVSRI